MNVTPLRPLNIAVIGSGISGLSCAWLLNKQHKVTIIEALDRAGGHSNTVNVEDGGEEVPIDTGFIVFNPVNYPNLVKFFEHLSVPSVETSMTFGVSIDEGKLEYSGSDLNGMFAQRSNLFKPRFWQLLREILKFYKHSDAYAIEAELEGLSLGELLEKHGYSNTFVYEHLLPMGAAIWSTPIEKMLMYPALTFLRFCANHGLVQVDDRPQWRTVVGGSRVYVDKILSEFEPNQIILNQHVAKVIRKDGRVIIENIHGEQRQFDHVVFACHSDQALAMLDKPSADEKRLLSRFPYQRNLAILHTDAALMPKRKKAWCAWNYLASGSQATQRQLCVTYWMNELQPLNTDTQYFVTLNPIKEPAPGSIKASFLYDHPAFDETSVAAQPELWKLQGQQNTWFCGAYFGYGFHEDGIQSGLAVAEQLGGMKRPWSLENPSTRIFVGPNPLKTQNPEKLSA
ncbi:MAG: NAD(P)/FAD-dependent oxidoreductase [Pontibacterium sp.]